MLDRFNLLISTSRGNERNACREIWYLLNELGDRNPESDVTPAIGLIAAWTSHNPLETTSRLRLLLKEKPWEVRYIQKIVPIERLVPAELTEITRLSRELADRIGKSESYRITVRKRHSVLRSKDIIEAVASNIDRRVDLENPTKILLVEVISNVAGLSLITSESILAVQKERVRLRR
jgi:tRNA acetyltransferase TAN1